MNTKTEIKVGQKFNSIGELPVGATFTRNLWAAQCFATTYYYLGEYQVGLNRSGKKIARKLYSSYGRRGNGSSFQPDKEMIVTSLPVDRDAVYSRDN